MFIRGLLLVIALISSGLLATENSRSAPTIDELIEIKTIRSVRISPDGKWIAYATNEADFDQDIYVTQLWLVDTKTHESFQLTRNKKSSTNPKWSPDGRWLAFTSSRDDKSQIYIISPMGGEAIQVTDSKGGINNYAWSHDSQRIAYLAPASEDEQLKEREKHVGDFFVVRKEYRHAHIWVLDIAKAKQDPIPGQQITKSDDYHVRDLAWSYDGTRLAFSATVNPDRINFHTADLFVYSFEDSSAKKIVSSAGPDWNPKWSPDDRQILFATYSGKELFYAFNSNFAIMPADGPQRLLTGPFDEVPRFVDWQKSGIYFSSLQKTNSHLFHLDPKTGETKRISLRTISWLPRFH
ncbi:DPP IV N-terminal domain-containing protein [bacterium]|nr:DPP IV N-terminal domain-containing protein [bacterium]